MLDAGPLIGLCYAPDGYSVSAGAGFRALARAGTRLVVPLPIVFEVYKWLLHRAGPRVARLSLVRIREAVAIVYPAADDLDRAVEIVARVPAWQGSLEDAIVAATALDLKVPVWTLNYRDMAAFPMLTFWTPGAG